MSKELLINKTLNECRAALVENGEIIDFLMDRVDPVKKIELGLAIFTKVK